jgi:hypothetical protein
MLAAHNCRFNFKSPHALHCQFESVVSLAEFLVVSGFQGCVVCGSRGGGDNLNKLLWPPVGEITFYLGSFELQFLTRSPCYGERVIVIDQTVAAVAVCHEMSWTT